MTYIRSICHDVGAYLGCGGHMSFLLRTSSGRFNLENAITLEQLEEFSKNGTLDEYLYGISLLFNKESELIYVKKQYKNFNTIRLHALGLI